MTAKIRKVLASAIIVLFGFGISPAQAGSNLIINNDQCNQEVKAKIIYDGYYTDEFIIYPDGIYMGPGKGTVAEIHISKKVEQGSSVNWQKFCTLKASDPGSTLRTLAYARISSGCNSCINSK